MTIESFKKDILPLKHPIYRYAMYMLKNADDAEDICQDVLIKIWEKREELGEVNNMRAWAITITRNKCLDFFKAKKIDSYSWNENMDAISNETPYEQLRVEDETKWVKHLMDQLPILQKDVFYLRHFEGESYKEISESLVIDENKVKVYLHRARTFIKESMEKKHSYGLKTG